MIFPKLEELKNPYPAKKQEKPQPENRRDAAPGSREQQSARILSVFTLSF
jgi:hypothetical protein